jgi:hypothetical protein
VLRDGEHHQRGGDILSFSARSRGENSWTRYPCGLTAAESNDHRIMAEAATCVAFCASARLPP